MTSAFSTLSNGVLRKSVSSCPASIVVGFPFKTTVKFPVPAKVNTPLVSFTPGSLVRASYADGAQSGFSIIGGQKIDRYSIYVDRKRSLAKEWDLGYGMSYRFAKDRDFQTYDKVTGDIPTENTDSRLREQTANVYVSLSKNYATGTSVSISATGEYYTIGNYRKWAVYPQASLTYVKSSEHLFQFSLSTDKTYPGYWDMQSSVSHLNGYTELWGTPGLKPSTAYNLNGNYIWKQQRIIVKYRFRLSYNIKFVLISTLPKQGFSSCTRTQLSVHHFLIRRKHTKLIEKNSKA
jgi:hypothetical protein